MNDAAAGALHDALGRIEDHWRRADSPLIHWAQPGIDPAAVDAATAVIGLKLPTQAKEWFAWHNGLTHSPEGQWFLADIGPPFALMSVEECVQIYVNELSLGESGVREGWLDDVEEHWPRHWFPLTRTVGSRHVLVVDTNPAAQPEARVGIVSHTERWPPKDVTLVDVATFWADCLDAGVYFWRNDRAGFMQDAGFVGGGRLRPFL